MNDRLTNKGMMGYIDILHQYLLPNFILNVFGKGNGAEKQTGETSLFVHRWWRRLVG
jgi:hypothetical protein